MNSSALNKPTSGQECPTRLLSDLPADEDAFGSHKRVAQAIVNLIKEEEGGKAIALTGSWGSGKSTVVNFVKSIIANKAAGGIPTQAVFIFDAWSHERDPLRRSFLEKFIDFLSDTNIKWIEISNWKETKEKLAKRLRISETITIPRLTPGGIAFTIAVLLVPIGLALLSTAENLSVRILWLGGFLSVSPLILILFMIIAKWGGENGNSDSDDEQKRNRRNDILRLLISRSETKVRNETIETPDPTSIEFQEDFRRILREALETDKNRRLLLVIDNLDRIDPENALSVWSTMRTFFEQDNHDEHPWMSRFWLLVPFDTEALSRLWGKETDGSDDLVSAFRDKTFQIAFRVSPPILSGWKDFFQKQFEFAFPAEHHKGDFHKIYRLFSLRGIPEDHPLTPRDIKLFINKVGALHRQWNDDIPLPFQALYVFYEKDIKVPEHDLTKEDLLGDIKNRILSLIGETEWQRYLAALHFNVEPERAIQVLIGRRVEEALHKGSHEDLSKLQNVPGFFEVCEHIVEERYQDWMEKEPEVIALAALALGSIETDEKPSLTHIWKYLKYSVTKTNQWQNLDKDIGQGLATILKFCRNDEFVNVAENILKAIGNIDVKSEEEPETGEPSESIQWIDGALLVIKEVHKAGHYDLLRKTFHVPEDAGFFVDVMLDLSEKTESDQILQCFAPEENQQQQIVAELAKICGNGEISKGHVSAIDLMMTIASDWPWQEFVTALNERLQGSNNLQSSEIVGCVGVLILIAYKGEVPEANEILNQLSTHGHLAHHLHQAQAENDTEAVSLCLLPILEAIPAGNLQSQVENSQDGIDFYNTILSSPEEHGETIDSLTQLILKFMNAEELIEKVEIAPETTNLVASVLGRIIKDEKKHEYITPALLIEKYDLISTVLSEACVDLVNQLIEKSNLLAEIQEHEFNPDLSELYLLIFKATENHRDSQYDEFLLEGIGSVQEERWSQEFDEEGSLLELALYLVEIGISLNLAVDFHDALQDYALNITDGEVSLSAIIQEKWGTLLDAFEDSWKDNFLKNLWDDLIQRADKGVELGLRLYGDDLLQAKVSKEKAAEIVRRLFSEILNRKNIEELIWLSRALQKGSIWKKCSDASKRPFWDRIEKEIREEDDDEIREQLDSIARTIGIDVSKIDIEDDNSTDSEEISEEE